jgi:hypothetical protein
VGVFVVHSEKKFCPGALNYDFGAEGRKLPPLKKAQYWREIPCEKDLEIAYWVSLVYSISYASVLETGIIGAYLLKWLKNGNIDIVGFSPKEKSAKKDENFELAFLEPLASAEKTETKLMAMLMKAKGTSATLQPEQFRMWCMKNYEQMQDWCKSLETCAIEKLENKGLSTKETVSLPDRKVLFFTVEKNRRKVVNHIQPSMKEEAIKMLGLKKFLLEFSRIAEKTVFEVHIWEEYLLFAQLLGIADKVREQLPKVYPEFNQISQLDTSTINLGAFVGSFAASAYNGVASGAGSDGGGGFSSSGGGGGAGGSASGGGFR